MKILVTGGAGYIGSHTIVALAAAGHEVVVLDNLINSEARMLDSLREMTGQVIPFYEGDVGDKALLGKIFTAHAVEGVIHFAAYKAVGESVANPLNYYHNNVANFVALLESVGEHHIRHFVFSSSAAVYGTPSSQQVTEETACAPASPYGQSKLMDEIILRDLCRAKPAVKGVALRYFNVVGAHPSAKIGELPKGKPQNLLPIIVQAVAGKTPPLTVYGTDYDTPDGSCLRDYVHVVDLAKAHVAALQKIAGQETGGYDVYNIGTGKPTSVLELITTFEKVNGVKVPYVIGARRAGDPAAYFAVPTKAERELHWRAEKTIDEACADAWRWELASRKPTADL
jgi:UDP-glucose 4-epimerase